MKQTKGYQIIIKDLDTGKTVHDETANAIIAGVDTASIVLTKANVMEIDSAVNSAENAVKETKKSVIKKFIANGFGDMLKDIMGDLKDE